MQSNSQPIWLVLCCHLSTKMCMILTVMMILFGNARAFEQKS